jgi:hypothetical protein
MAPQNQNQRSFDPSRDIDDYLIDDAEALRQRGLQKQSIRFYELLCRLCLPGESQLVYRQQADLVSDLKRLAPEDDGLTEGSVSRKLNRLTSLGFASKFGGGQSNCMLIIEIFLPDLVEMKPPRPRQPVVAVTPSGERQGQFFGGGGQFRLVGCADDPPKAQTLALSKAQSLSVSPAESASVCAFEPAPAEQHTSYTRTRVRASAVDDVDDDVVVSSSKVAESEIQEARNALKRSVATWRQTGIPEKQRNPLRRNLANWIKAHTLMLRGRIPPAAFDASLSAVIAAHHGGGIKVNAYAVMWGVWRDEVGGDDEISALMRSLELPLDWEVQMRGLASGPIAVTKPRPVAETAQEPAPTPPKLQSPVVPSRRKTRAEILAEIEAAVATNGHALPHPEACPNGEEPQRE